MSDEKETEEWISGELERLDATSPAGSAASESYLYTEYKHNLLGFVSGVLGNVTHDRNFDHKAAMHEGQRAVFKAVEKFKYCDIFSSRGFGKGYAVSRLMLAVFYTRPCRILCLAPSMRQLQAILFSEVSKAFHGARQKLRGELQTMKLKMPGDERHYILGIPAADPDRARGFHGGAESPGDPDADFITEEDRKAIEEFVASGGDETDELWIFADEACGIPNEVFQVLEGTLSKVGTHMVCIGNPSMSLFDEHYCAKALRSNDKDRWRINFSSIPHSEFPGENEEQLAMFDEIFDDPPRWLIPQEARDKAMRSHDSQDPIFLSDMRGLFSEDALGSQVIPYTALLVAEELHEANTQRNRLGPRIGIDLGFGGDMSVATLMVNGVVRDIVAWRDSRDDRTMQVTVAKKISGLCDDWGRTVHEAWPESWDGGAIVGSRLSIDATGLAGVCDILSQMGVESNRVNFSAAYNGDSMGLVDGSYEMANMRAGLYWFCRMSLQEGLVHVPFTDKYKELRKQLPWTLYERDDYKIKLEPKMATIKEHGHSPDYADSFVLACYAPNDRAAIWSTGGPLLTPDVDMPTAKNFGRKRDPRKWTKI